MHTYLKHSVRASMLVASLMSSQALADFGFDDALSEMSHAVGKIQKKFSKMHDSFGSSMHSMIQGGFSAKGNIMNTRVNDADLIISVAQELDKESIKAVVHHDVLTITAHNKNVELELNIDRKPNMVKMNIQHRVETAEDKKSGGKDGGVQKHISYSSQQVMQSLPVSITLDDVAVEYENSVLTIKLSRLDPVVSSKVINVIKK